MKLKKHFVVTVYCKQMNEKCVITDSFVLMAHHVSKIVNVMISQMPQTLNVCHVQNMEMAVMSFVKISDIVAMECLIQMDKIIFHEPQMMKHVMTVTISMETAVMSFVS